MIDRCKLWDNRRETQVESEKRMRNTLNIIEVEQSILSNGPLWKRSHTNMTITSPVSIATRQAKAADRGTGEGRT